MNNNFSSKKDQNFDKYTDWLFKNPKLNWLRWILVLPSALLASYIPTIFTGILNNYYEPSQWMIDYLEGPVGSFVAPIFYVTIGSYMAPKFKKNTALGLIVLFLLLIGVFIFFAFVKKEYLEIFLAMMAILGSVIGYKLIEDFDNK